MERPWDHKTAITAITGYRNSQNCGLDRNSEMGPFGIKWKSIEITKYPNIEVGGVKYLTPFFLGGSNTAIPRDR